METLLHGFSIYLLIFCRMSAFFVTAPIFSTRGVPAPFKIGLSAMIAFIILMIQGTDQTLPGDLGYILFIFREVLIGLLMGFVANLFFTVIQMAGSFIDLQMGLSMANVLDPMTGTTAPITGNFKYIIAVLVFLSINGHHYLIDGVIRSYNWIPLSNDVFQRIYHGNLGDFLASTFSNTFTIALQMAAPLVVAMFLADVALGFLAKTAPQFNVFVIGIPLKILLGFAVLLILIPGFIYAFEHLFETMFKALHNLFGALGNRPS